MRFVDDLDHLSWFFLSGFIPDSNWRCARCLAPTVGPWITQRVCSRHYMYSTRNVDESRGHDDVVSTDSL